MRKISLTQQEIRVLRTLVYKTLQDFLEVSSDNDEIRSNYIDVLKRLMNKLVIKD